MLRHFVLAGISLLVFTSTAGAQQIEFKNALTNAPLDVKPTKTEIETPQVVEFKTTGVNPYLADAAALEAGKKIYTTNCAACHLPDGTGRIGPNLVDDTVVRERVANDIGMFEIVYGGGSGAMQSFHRRGMVQDDMLKVTAYVRSLKK
ncbi:MAG TPA: c-type cytochrome [Bradyrhizobium sp.]|nr:c-type cytochrome [Bradyrhizobium sp.]